MTTKRTLTVSIVTENAAFEGEGLYYESARMLRDIAERIELGDLPEAYSNVYDSNGNAAGRYRLRDETYPD